MAAKKRTLFKGAFLMGYMAFFEQIRIWRLIGLPCSRPLL